MNKFEDFKQASYKLIAEYIDKKSADVAIPAVIDVVEKLLSAKDLQIDRLANEKATQVLNDQVKKILK